MKEKNQVQLRSLRTRGTVNAVLITKWVDLFFFLGRNQELGFDYAKFDMTGMYPNEIIEEMVGSLSLKFRKEVELEKL